MAQAEHLLAIGNRLGEGPLWHPAEETLYWVDIEGETIYRISTETGEPEGFPAGQPVGCLAFRESGGLALGTRDGLGYGNLPEITPEIIHTPEPGRANSRFNDGKVDRKGRFWAGTLGEDDQSKLYRWDPDGSLQAMQTGVQISNGIGWSPDDSLMYYTDSPKGLIYLYDFDLESGVIDNRREFASVQPEDGVPDGLTVDSDGFVWSAHWDGWRITRYDPEGKIERVIYLPVQRPTSCTFGGTELDQLFITSARTGLSEADLRDQPLAGDLFLLAAEVKGQKETFFSG